LVGFENIQKVFHWFDSLKLDEQANVKAQLKNFVTCEYNLYLEAENEGKVNSDSEITENAVKYAAAKCIDDVTIEKIKAFFSGVNSE
jgi:hypothetical protein